MKFLPKGKIPTIGKFPVALKVDSDKVLHKSDKEALILGIKNNDELNAAAGRLQANFPGERLVVQAMHDKKVEIILGIKNDAIFWTNHCLWTRRNLHGNFSGWSIF